MNYYDTPPQGIFEDIIKACISVWKDYDDTYGYATEKIAQLPKHNVKDNALYALAMFDVVNQRKVLKLIMPESKKFIYDRVDKDQIDLWENDLLALEYMIRAMQYDNIHTTTDTPLDHKKTDNED